MPRMWKWATGSSPDPRRQSPTAKHSPNLSYVQRFTRRGRSDGRLLHRRPDRLLARRRTRRRFHHHRRSIRLRRHHDARPHPQRRRDHLGHPRHPQESLPRRRPPGLRNETAGQQPARVRCPPRSPPVRGGPARSVRAGETGRAESRGERHPAAPRGPQGAEAVTADGDDSRAAIHEAIREHAVRGQDAILTGWYLVAEWIDHDGERWLSRAYAAATSEWAAKGMCHEALYGDWPDGGDD